MLRKQASVLKALANALGAAEYSDRRTSQIIPESCEL
jgi:hypothetical protein